MILRWNKSESIIQSSKYDLKYIDDPQFHFHYKSNQSSNLKYQSELLSKGYFNDKIEITIKKASIQMKPALKRLNNSGIKLNYLQSYKIKTLII